MHPNQTLRLHSLDPQWLNALNRLDEKTWGGRWTQQGYAQEIERENSICLGISDSKSELLAMGFIWVILDEAHLISIAVDPDWQRRGLGKLLLAQLLLDAADRSCNRATLEVNASNMDAIKLYQRLNFQALGTRPNYYGKGEDAVIYWLNQLQHHHVQSSLQQVWNDCQQQMQQCSFNIELDLQ